VRNTAAVFIIVFFVTGCSYFRPSTRPADKGEGGECAKIEELSEAGEHMAAIEVSRSMIQDVSTCPPRVSRKLSDSFSIVNRADSLVRRAFAQRRKGDLAAARKSLEKALSVYPRYYWVSNLLRDLERSITNRVRELKEEAEYLESQGDLAGAANRTRAAMELAPHNVDLHLALARIEGRKSKVEATELARRSIIRADNLLEHGRFDEAEKTLAENQAVKLLGKEANRVLQRIRTGRVEYGRKEFDAAKEATDSGDFDKAVLHLGNALGQGEIEKSLKDEIVEYMKLLGMRYYSKGELTRAREVWNLAIESDPENPTLQKYIYEVEVRLDSLRKIKEHQNK